MGLSLKPDHLRRYRDIAALLIKYGRSDLLFSTEWSDGSSAAGDELASDLEELGPTFVKVGQLLSTRGDLLSQPALRSLALVASSYGLPQRSLGSVSVIGPLRMDYGHAIHAVRDAASQLSTFIADVYDER